MSWEIGWKCVVKSMDIYGNLWKVYGNSMESLWKVYGKSMETKEIEEAPEQEFTSNHTQKNRL